MSLASKLDLYRKYKNDYLAPKSPVVVRLKPAVYLTLSGQGSPCNEAFSDSIGALYAVAYTLKMAKKKSGRDYKVCMLEGLWWAATPGADLMHEPPEEWRWKLLIRTPEFIRTKDVQQAAALLLKKGKSARVAEVKIEKLDEGKCVQMLHVGPYAQENQTITMMQMYAASNDLSFRGIHHEIYLSDPRRVAETKLKTILRHPVQ